MPAARPRHLIALALLAALAVAGTAQAHGAGAARRHALESRARSHRRRVKPTPKSAAASPCGTRSAGGSWQHVVWIVMENKPYGAVIGSHAAPYLNRLAASCGLATRYSAVSHPSLPNYVAMTSGDTQGIGDDGPLAENATSAESIFAQLGTSWRLYAESMPANCSADDSGNYAVKHNPAAYYTSLASTCASNDLPLPRTPALTSAFTFVVPNLCDDMHDCGVSSGDRWLRAFMQKLVATPEYRSGRTAIFITWDEDDGGSGNHVPLLVIAPSVRRGTRAGARFDHYSLLRTTEEMLGLGPLGSAAQAQSMRSAFGL